MTKPWPQSAGTGIAGLITSLRKIGDPAGGEDKPSVLTTPYSLQDIKSGSAALSKLWALVVAAAGGGPAFWALVKGITTDVVQGTSDQPSVRVALILGGAGLMSVVAVSIAIIVRGDVAARALAHAARVQAEGNIVTTALTNYRFGLPSGWIARKIDGTYLPIAKFNRTDSGVILTTRTGDILMPPDYDAIVAASDLTPDGG